MSQDMLKRCIDCGYITEEALGEVGRLPIETVRMLAAMAITHHDSPWSDNGRDLVRGCVEVLGRDYHWDTL